MKADWRKALQDMHIHYGTEKTAEERLCEHHAGPELPIRSAPCDDCAVEVWDVSDVQR